MSTPWPPAPPPVDPPGATAAPPPVRPALRRSRDDKVIGGVAGGLAEYSGIDALLWRVGFVAVTFAGGTGIIVYLLLWLLMPAGRRATGAEKPAPSAPAEPPEPRSPVPRITLAAGLIAVGLLVLLDRFTGLDIAAPVYPATALLVVGLGLVAAAFTSGRRAKGALIVLGVVLTLATAAVATPWTHLGGIGDHDFRPATSADIRDVYSNGIGDMELDLSGIDVSDLDEPITTRIDGGIGDVDVVVPRDADVRVHVSSGIGDVRLFDGGPDEGFYPGTGIGPHTGDGEPEIVLTIHSGIGDVEVSRG